MLKCTQGVEKDHAMSNSLTSLLLWHHFSLDLTHVCCAAKIGTVLSNLHAPPVSSGSPNLKRDKSEEEGEK